MRGLRGRIALVTGGTGLLGGAIATRLAAEQATVAITSRSISKAKHWIQNAEKIENAGPGNGNYIPVELDLANEQSIDDCLAYLEEHAALPTIVVANASLREGVALPFEKITHESFTKLFAVDIAGHVLLVRRIVERLPAQPASIIFLSSIYAQAGVDHRIYTEGMAPTPVQYAGVKAAAEGAARWLAASWGERGVRVNALVSGGIASKQRQSDEFVKRYCEKTMLRRMARAEEVAAAAAFLASEESSYITGQCLVVDGGWTAW
jgi:NAD(P)-dependent dehydrogenase (short-subunit alcohol dehydrogenase family)